MSGPEENSSSKTRTAYPIVTGVLIFLNFLVFVCLQGRSSDGPFSYKYCMIPREIITGYRMEIDGDGYFIQVTGNYFRDHYDPDRVVAPVSKCFAPESVPRPVKRPRVMVTEFTYIFLHNNWKHLLNNMVFLLVFGAVIEAVVGRLKYLLLYFGSGFLCALVTALVIWRLPQYGMNSCLALTPEVGASGAMAGIVGAYLSLLPKLDVRGVHLVPEIGMILPMHEKFPYVMGWLLAGFWLSSEFVIAYMNRKDLFADMTNHVGHIAGGVTGFFLAQLSLESGALILVYFIPLLWPLLREYLAGR